MNKIKKYDKSNRISIYFNFIFGIYSFYKYDSKKTYEIVVSNLEGMLLYKETNGKEVKVIESFNGDMITFSKNNEREKIKHIYNAISNTFKKDTEIGEKNKIQIKEYIDPKGVFSRELIFTVNKNKLNGKSKD